MTLLQRLGAWRDAIAALDPAAAAPHLSPAGARAALAAATAPLTADALEQAIRRDADPFDRAAVVIARTVFTAAIEWCAVLLGRGTEVVLKHPAAVPGICPAMARLGRAHGLPLSATADRSALRNVELCVAMGSDATIAAIRADLPEEVRLLGFGHRYSVAWIIGAEAFAAVAEDAALHDGLGCMSPVAVLTPLPLDEAVVGLARAMADTEVRLPRGAIPAAHGAAIRVRQARARATGISQHGPGWSVHGLPTSAFRPGALPRSLALHTVADRHAFVEILGDRRHLSTVGTDDPGLDLAGVRICPPGRMQHPPLDRLHDGVHWLTATARIPVP